MSLELFISIFLATTMFVSMMALGIHLEKKGFNKGKCPECGGNLKQFDVDSHGGRGYCCHKCNYHTWVSYNCVDKNFTED
jgi:tRNA(Ile2) C34 agmatinyltransferase TiaS